MFNMRWVKPTATKAPAPTWHAFFVVGVIFPLHIIAGLLAWPLLLAAAAAGSTAALLAVLLYMPLFLYPAQRRHPGWKGFDRLWSSWFDYDSTCACAEPQPATQPHGWNWSKGSLSQVEEHWPPSSDVYSHCTLHRCRHWLPFLPTLPSGDHASPQSKETGTRPDGHPRPKNKTSRGVCTRQLPIPLPRLPGIGGLHSELTPLGVNSISRGRCAKFRHPPSPPHPARRCPSYFGAFGLEGTEHIDPAQQYFVASHPHGTVIFQRMYWRTAMLGRYFKARQAFPLIAFFLIALFFPFRPAAAREPLL
jgi:hypothetical protein